MPQDHFYRHLERTLDLSFIREFVNKTYAGGGRLSIDPIMFFKLRLVMFFEGIRSERQLMRHAADRLSVRWFLGYDLFEPLPDHSSLTKIRTRYGIEVFRRFFEAVVEQCQQEGLVWGRELYLDSTKVEANASVDSVKPRFFVEEHLANLFSPEAVKGGAEAVQEMSQEEPTRSEHEEPPAPRPPPTSLSPEEDASLTQHNEARHDWIEQDGAQHRRVTSRGYHRMADLRVSTTDPDATLMPTKDGTDMGYRTHYVVDGGRARIIVAALVTPKARHGQSTDARSVLARPFPLETLATTGDWRPQIRQEGNGWQIRFILISFHQELLRGMTGKNKIRRYLYILTSATPTLAKPTSSVPDGECRS